MIEDNESKNNSKSKGKSSADFPSEVDIPDIMKDIKDRGVRGIAGGIADVFTGNLFDFDGKNLKPDEMKNAMIDKGESVTTKMIAALDGARATQTRQVMSKQNSGTGKKMKIPARPTSKSSPSSINKSLQPGL